MKTHLLKKLICSLILLSCITWPSFALDSIILSHDEQLVSSEFYYFIPENESDDVDKVMANIDQFQKIETSILPGYTFQKNNTVWVLAELENQNILDNSFRIRFENTTIDEIRFYYVDSNSNEPILQSTQGQKYPFTERSINHPEFIYDLSLEIGKSKTVLFCLNNQEQQAIPIRVGSKTSNETSLNDKNILNGIFAGIFIVMFFYNLTLFLFTRYKIYAYYSAYVLFVGLGLINWVGYTFSFVWPNQPWFAQRSFILFLSLTAIFGILFAQKYLTIKKTNPKFNYVLNFFIGGYVLASVFLLFDISIAQNIINPLGISAFVLLAYSIYQAIKGSRQALIYLVAWSFYLVGVLVFFFREFSLIEHNHLTQNLIQYGSALELILLSLALADRINSLRKEKKEIIEKQNSILEEKVNVRTRELQSTLTDLKTTQTQLVEAEKMASLGQLTAGVAHEINNPINFVSSNIKPLELDLNDLYSFTSKVEEIALSDSENKAEQLAAAKKEMDFEFTKNEIQDLISGIKNGAQRTAEIVKSLKIFSNLNNTDLKLGHVHDGLDSTLLILKTKRKGIDIIKEYGDLKEINSLHGQLNQVFMNVLDNAIYACHKKEYLNGEKPEISISTEQSNELTTITLSDNGVGMSEQTMQKIYEPFYTNKPVGEGTGLGMSIVHGILQKINGELNINSTEGVGTQIALTLKHI